MKITTVTYIGHKDKSKPLEHNISKSNQEVCKQGKI